MSDEQPIRPIDQPAGFGNLSIGLKDNTIPHTLYDRIAVSHDNTMMLVSLVGEANKIKAIRAFLNSGASVRLEASRDSKWKGGQVSKHSEWLRFPAAGHSPGRMRLSSDGYNMHLHKLDYGMVQAMFISKAEGFMPVLDEEALWQELTSTRYTTPILRVWMPLVMRKLKKQGLLLECDCYRCECGEILAQTRHLDEVVSSGLRDGEIFIPGSPQQEAAFATGIATAIPAEELPF